MNVKDKVPYTANISRAVNVAILQYQNYGSAEKFVHAWIIVARLLRPQASLSLHVAGTSFRGTKFRASKKNREISI